MTDQVGRLIGETEVKVQPGRVGNIVLTDAVHPDNRRVIPIKSCLLAIMGKVGKSLRSGQGSSHQAERKSKCKTCHDGVC